MKLENGHTLPETALLPSLSQFLGCSIDSILMPFASQDSDFRNFAKTASCESAKLGLLLYEQIKNKFDFTINYDEKYYIFENVYNGGSATFNSPSRQDFIIRLDITENDNILAARVPLPNCSNYIDIIEMMPEYIKKKFRYSDCTGCNCNCTHAMKYIFEGTEYKQCHFVSFALNSKEDVEYVLALLSAEHS